MLDHGYIGIPNTEREAPIHRYTTVDRLLELVVQKENTLTSPRKWDDPYEDALARSILMKRSDGSFIPYPLRDRVYGQCWTLASETDAFWRMYVPQGGGVRLRSTIRKLFQSLYQSQTSYASFSCCVGRVVYKPETAIITLFEDHGWVKEHFVSKGADGHAQTLLLKREEFSPEQEIRLLFFDPRNRNHGDHFKYNIDPANVLLGVTFDPRMEDSTYKTYAAILRGLGFGGEIAKSTLYRAPKIEISV